MATVMLHSVQNLN